MGRVMRKMLGILFFLLPTLSFSSVEESGIFAETWMSCQHARKDSPFYLLDFMSDEEVSIRWRYVGDEKVYNLMGEVQFDPNNGVLQATANFSEESRILFTGSGWTLESSDEGALFSIFLVQSLHDNNWRTVNGFPVVLVPIDKAGCHVDLVSDEFSQVISQ